MQLFVNTLTKLWFAIVILHDVQTLIDRLLVLQGEHQPTSEHSTSHRCHCAIYHIQQRLAIILHRIQQLQRAHCKLIQTYILIFLNARDRGDMSYLCMQRLLQILQNSTSSYHTILHVVDAKTLQRLHIEVLI